MILETTAVVGVTATKLVSYGVCLCIGFWIGKKITNKIDEKLLMYDRKTLQKLEQEMNLEHT